ncbi:MAG: IclR family transcriptional regulator [Armatimonadota bacterium]|nr:IclR family transcriptional regulator [Armatimonadota bacterium]MDR7452131.1 IclR family transcriptional regulator [Armatimonadota bacterium]MDR7467855.1 IclR family transcriptional regulator [Armatimonadota bacterium]MDR7494743.1 IclR family transcriptional regulator [Armatimonadota bacterium]MDR7499568.1 IclR family transcriptional regulator [Armatimonadota bacterium]
MRRRAPAGRGSSTPRSFPAGGSARAAERTLDILLAFLREGREMGISELSRIVRLPKATVHRLVQVLVSRGFLARDPATAGYRVGLTPFRLGNLFLAQTHVRQVALPVIHELARRTGETVNLNVVVDRHRICIEKAESPQDIRHAVELGRPLPLYAGASGKVLLAHLPEEEIEAVLAAGIHRFTPRTIVDPARLRRSLAEIRRRGYAVTSDERVAGASAVSAPIRNGAGRVVAGLTISGPTYRFTPDRVRSFITLVREGARQISAALGYGPAGLPRARAR